jgi:hypothetical protein
MRAIYLAASALGVLALSACGKSAPEPETVTVALDKATPAPAASEAAAATAPVNDYGATPMGERVAVIGLLNKRNNVTEEIKLKPGENRTIGPVIIRLSACERTAPWELPQETGAFVQVDIRERGQGPHRRVFSGWLFRESPSLNVVEHPVYDVWIKDCTMRFPGEEGSAAPAKEPAGKKPAPAPSATPEPAPAAPTPAALTEA